MVKQGPNSCASGGRGRLAQASRHGRDQTPQRSNSGQSVVKKSGQKVIKKWSNSGDALEPRGRAACRARDPPSAGRQQQQAPSRTPIDHLLTTPSVVKHWSKGRKAESHRRAGPPLSARPTPTSCGAALPRAPQYALSLGGPAVRVHRGDGVAMGAKEGGLAARHAVVEWCRWSNGAGGQMVPVVKCGQMVRVVETMA